MVVPFFTEPYATGTVRDAASGASARVTDRIAIQAR